MFFGTHLSSSSERQWMADCFQEDYQDTQVFRDYLSDQFLSIVSLWTGGRHQYGRHYDTERWWGGDYNLHPEDRNIRYTLSVGGMYKHSNDSNLGPDTKVENLPVGYNLLLQFDGRKARVWKDGQEVDLYGDGFYSEDSPWSLPGYQNFTASQAMREIRVTMAVIQRPVPGPYDEKGIQQFSPLYRVVQNLQDGRRDVLVHLARIGAGAALLALYVLLRRDKQRADRFLARGTGKVWFEVKAAGLLVLAVLLLPQVAVSHASESAALTGGSGSTSADIIDSTSEDEAISFSNVGQSTYSEVTVIRGPDGVSYELGYGNLSCYLTNYLWFLGQYSAQTLTLFWACYLLVNDLRYNKKSWRHGVLGMLAARGLRLPVQKRMSRSAGLIALAFGAVALEAGYLYLALVYNYGGPLPLWWYLIVLGPCVVALILLVWVLARQKSLWTDLGALVDQIARLRAGSVDTPLNLPPDHDLHPAAEDLNHVQQGLHQAVEEHIRSERMKVELVTNVSHDLKTPLTSILSYTELLAQEPLDPPASEYVQILGEKSQRLKAMVQDVFEVSKAASGQLPVKLEELDLGRLLRQTLADMDGAIRDSGLTLRTDIPGQPVPITADSDRMYRVFQNLLGNALKYSLPGSRVYLTLEVENGRAAASVKNTSATELKPGVDYTGRFVRGDESRSDGGSGLGLSIADSFTRACGGELTITTEADLFTARVSFPLSAGA